MQIVTKAPGLSPEEVERLVTFPIEQQVTGVPHLTELRSLTKVGLSLITVVFDDQMDINLARQLVLERLIEVQEHLPPGSEPMMSPNSTGLGEVYQYYLEGPPHAGLDAAAVERELIEQRTVVDWVIRPLLKGVPGVIERQLARWVCQTVPSARRAGTVAQIRSLTERGVCRCGEQQRECCGQRAGETC